MAEMIAVGIFIMFGGGFVVLRGIQEENRRNEEALPDAAQERIEFGCIHLNSTDTRQSLADKMENVYIIRSHEGQNLLNRDYAISACLKPTNTLCIYAATKRRNVGRNYVGIILGSYHSLRRKRCRLIFDIDVIVALRGWGKKVIGTLLNQDFAWLRDLADAGNTNEICFRLKAINDDDLIAFYERHGFAAINEEVDGLIPMQKVVQLNQFHFH